jgi:hypothetical protein
VVAAKWGLLRLKKIAIFWSIFGLDLQFLKNDLGTVHFLAASRNQFLGGGWPNRPYRGSAGVPTIANVVVNYFTICSLNMCSLWEESSF